MADTAITVSGLSKIYSSGLEALKSVDLQIQKGEIFALLGPNGAGKTTLINIICGIVNPSSGSVTVEGFDIIKDFRKTRSKIGLVPQELATDMYAEVQAVLAFSRGLFGKASSPQRIEQTLKSLSLWDKRNSRIRTLSGGMKRRVLIAKALVHEPSILFLDEPTAGVDVSLRRDMWALVRQLRDEGVTVILTTHYIEEAQEMADRIGVMNKGELIIVEEKATLMKKLGKKQLRITLTHPLKTLDNFLVDERLSLSSDGTQLIFTFDGIAERTGIPELMKKLGSLGIDYKDLQTKESSLEDIFVTLVRSSP